MKPMKLFPLAQLRSLDLADRKKAKQMMNDLPDTTVKKGVVLLPTLSPRRAIKPDILLEFDLKVKRAGDGIDSYQQLIQGVSEHPSGGHLWSRVNELSIRSDGDRLIPVMRVKLAMNGWCRGHH